VKTRSKATPSRGRSRVGLAPHHTPPLEKAEQAFIIKLFRSVGITVCPTSQGRPSRVYVGLPDLLLYGKEWSGCWETKRYKPSWVPARGGERVHYSRFDPTTWTPMTPSPEQFRFLSMATAAGQRVGWGGRREAEDWLVTHGYAVREGGGLRIVTRELAPWRDPFPLDVA
jgi:hypothetical protein